MDEANLRSAQGGLPGEPRAGGRRSVPSVLVHHPGVIPARPAQELDRLHADRARGLARDGRSGRLGSGLRIAVETLFVESEEEYTADPVRLAARDCGRSAIRTSWARSTSATAT